MTTPIFTIKDFSFSYPFSSQTISLPGEISIGRGECILISGASGSGKSTLLAALKGLIPHYINGHLDGEIQFCGRSIGELNSSEMLAIGYLQQNPDSQLICPDVFSELAFALENLGFAPEEIQARIVAICQKFAVSHLLSRKTATLSGGEKQKINLLAILLMEPEVILLDEPTAFLDPDSAWQIAEILQEYLHHKTIIIIEHNQHYFEKMINRGLLIGADGQINMVEREQIDWHQSLTNTPATLAADSPTILEINNLHFSYSPDVKLLNNISLKLHAGEIIAICGSNGSGKSTLLKLIAGIIGSSGAIFWQQQDITQLKRSQLWRDLRLIWQNPENHFIYSKVQDELALQPELLEQFNLAELKSHNPFNLSEGQKRRLSLAIGLSGNSQLLLLDEPTFGQDYQNKQMLAEVLLNSAARGTAIIMVSHDEDFVHSLCQRVYQLKDGQLVSRN